jgi:hypothetical protein
VAGSIRLKEALHPNGRLLPAFTIWVRLGQAGPPECVDLLDRGAVQPPVIAFPQPPIGEEGDRQATERYLGRLERPSKVRAEDCCQPVVGSSSPERRRLLTAE